MEKSYCIIILISLVQSILVGQNFQVKSLNQIEGINLLNESKANLSFIDTSSMSRQQLDSFIFSFGQELNVLIRENGMDDDLFLLLEYGDRLDYCWTLRIYSRLGDNKYRLKEYLPIYVVSRDRTLYGMDPSSMHKNLFKKMTGCDIYNIANCSSRYTSIELGVNNVFLSRKEPKPVSENSICSELVERKTEFKLSYFRERGPIFLTNGLLSKIFYCSCEDDSKD